MMAEEGNKLILYTADCRKSLVSLMSRYGRIWLNQKQMAELFCGYKDEYKFAYCKHFERKRAG